MAPPNRKWRRGRKGTKNTDKAAARDARAQALKAYAAELDRAAPEAEIWVDADDKAGPSLAHRKRE